MKTQCHGGNFLGRLPIAKNDSPGKYKEACIVSHEVLDCSITVRQ